MKSLSGLTKKNTFFQTKSILCSFDPTPFISLNPFFELWESRWGPDLVNKSGGELIQILKSTR